MSRAAVFFLQALLVVGLPYFLWRICRMRKVLPMVVVQILVGIVLGHSVFGQLSPQWWSVLFGPAQLSMLAGLQWLAVTLFCFLTGLHLREMEVDARPHVVLAVSAGSIVLPMAAGTAAGAWLGTVLPLAAGPHVGPYWFAIAVGVCAAVTALPVLGAILDEMRMHGTRLGSLALACAAVNDGLIWVLLTIILVGHGYGEGMQLGTLLALAVAYLAAFGLLVRPALAWLTRGKALDTEPLLILALLLIFTSALAAEMSGLHHVLGGFIAGLVWPRHLARRVRQHLEPATMAALLPFFFLYAGLRAEISIGGREAITIFVVSLAVSVASKIVGVAVPGRIAGLDWRQALALGSLLQTKGLVELVVLAILFDAGIIGSAAFSGLLLMAVASTVLARPLTEAVLGVRDQGRSAEGAAKRASQS